MDQRLDDIAAANDAAIPVRPDTAGEARIIQHMREQGTLPRWEAKDVPPPAVPKTIHRLVLALAGGIRLKIDDEFHGRMVYIHLPREATGFRWDCPLNDIARDLPARLLPVFRAAVADLEQITAAENIAGMRREIDAEREAALAEFEQVTGGEEV